MMTKTYMTVGADTLASTTACPKDLSCLKNQDWSMCQVTACLDDDVYFVNCGHKGNCVYQSEVDGRMTCTCPVRKKIFQRYGK